MYRPVRPVCVRPVSETTLLVFPLSGSFMSLRNPLSHSHTTFIRKLGCAYLCIPFFLIFDPKHRLWVLIRTASARPFLACTHNLCFEQDQEIYQTFSTELFSILQCLNLYITHGHVFSMCESIHVYLIIR